MYFLRRAQIDAPRSSVSNVIANCQIFQSIDPAPVRWEKGSLSVGDVWQSGHGNNATSWLIDCGPSRFLVWRKIRRQDSSSIVDALEGVFLSEMPPQNC